jgi:hypothetical protein
VRAKAKLAEIEKEHGVIFPARFPKRFGRLESGRRWFVLDAGGKRFDGL